MNRNFLRFRVMASAVLVSSILALAASKLYAQDSLSLREAVALAAQKNPAVLSAWDAFKAAKEGVKVAKGGYYPKLDVISEIGSERSNDALGVENSYTNRSSRVTLTQMLFDGFATKHEVARQSYIRLGRFYEFRQASEEVALETVQSYLDVLRYRELVELAKENYVHHLKYHKDIQERVNSGIGRGVDLEQARARLALAESNLLTENTNLHDVSVRFQRLVGRFPAKNMSLPPVPEGYIPADRRKALVLAFELNPELNASIENIRATRAEFRASKAPMKPRFDLRLRKQVDKDERGVEGTYEEDAVELVMTYNLYNGGSDISRKRQTRYLMYEATDIRDRICREVRQTVSIAHNDINSNRRLVSLYERNEEAIGKAREAYKNQFEIGQRTLLDLLDTENEYFEVKRTLVSARSALLLAQYRTLGGIGYLLRAMGVKGAAGKEAEELDFSRESALNARCPAEAPPPVMRSLEKDIQDLLARKKESYQIPLSAREVMRLDVKFANQSAEVLPDTWSEIVRAAKFLCDNPQIKGIVEGHTDSVGSSQYNLTLSQARAESVKLALIQECLSASNRLSAKGYGEARPVARNDSELGRATNRRVELVLETLDSAEDPEDASPVIIEKKDAAQVPGVHEPVVIEAPFQDATK